MSAQETKRREYKNGRLWVLGGNDGEMEVIKHLLGMAGEDWVQPKREWGNHVYGLIAIGCDAGTNRSEFLAVMGLKTIFLVECKPDATSMVNRGGTVVIDHHGERANEPASVFQVLDVLEKSGLRISWQTRRWVELVAANDCGAYGGMEALGASREEMDRVRHFTKKAQGITEQDEEAARLAVKAAKVHGKVMVVILPNDKFAPVIDQLYSQGRDGNILVVSPKKLNFFGDGAMCFCLKERFGGWAGGAGLKILGDLRSFWGCNTLYGQEVLKPEDYQEVLQFMHEAWE